MKILYVLDVFSENGGVERIVSEKANILSTQYHHNITLISLYVDNRIEQYNLDNSVNKVKLNVPFVKRTNNMILKYIYRIRTILIAIHRLNKVVKKLDPDIIFFTTTLGAIILPFCHTNAMIIYESHLARNFSPFNHLFFLTELKAERIICLTSGDAKEYKYAKRVDIIPNFINDVKSCVKDYSVKKAIAVGRLEYQKGFDILIDLWKEISKQYPNWQLDIYGEGSYRDKLQQQIVKLQLEDKVNLCGRSNNIFEIYPQYSIHLMTSRYEGLPMTLIEAQSCGLPSVVFNFQYGASDIIFNECNGFIVEQGNNKLFVEAIYKLLSSEKLRKEFGKNALSIGRSYSKENIFSKWVELIDNIKLK